MSGTSACEAVERAVTAVHEIAHLTRPAVTSLEVSELRTVTGALAELVAGLPQTLHQLSNYLHATDNLITTDDRLTDPQAAVDRARSCLQHSGAVATDLAAALDEAHQTLSEIAEMTESGARGSTIGRL
jgi:hypothetical protein